MRVIIAGLAVAAAVAAGAASPRAAEACSCAPPPPPCEVYWLTDAVFTGKVTNVVAASNGAEQVTLAIDEKFRGPSMASTLVVESGGVCGATLRQGERYFVYASSNGGAYYASLCSRTRPLADAGDDLAYAHALPKRRLGVVEGVVSIESDIDPRTKDPRGGAIVRAQGTTYSTQAAANGRYKLGLPAGTYKLEVVDTGTILSRGTDIDVALPDAAACARRNLDVVWNGRIRGRLTDHTGAPAAHVSVTAHAAANTYQHWRVDTTTDAAGHYELEGVQAGSWLIAINHPSEGGPGPDQPIPTTFYPGAPTEAAAKPVTVTRSDIVDKIDFQLPAPLAIHTVTGIVRKAGKPLASQFVQISNKTYPRGSGAETDSSGRYTFKDVHGSELEFELCRADANPRNYKTACKQVVRRLDKDLTGVDLDMPR
jgi:carboxypeptidase family protein